MILQRFRRSIEVPSKKPAIEVIVLGEPMSAYVSEPEAWDKPVFTMTYTNPDGGDGLAEVKSNVGHLIFYFEEE